MAGIQDLLGHEAKDLLTYTAQGIPNEDLVLPGPDFVDRTVAATDRSPRVLRNLQSLFDHGRLAGTGYVSILQKMRHGGDWGTPRMRDRAARHVGDVRTTPSTRTRSPSSTVIPASYETEAAAMQPVVTVGLDGSPESLAAAHWAADEAEKRKLTLRLLHAWPLLVPEPTRVPSEVDQNYWAKRLVHTARAELQARQPGLSIVGNLVAGRREHRPGLAPHLGPVAQAAIHHGRCPVAVVPHD